MQQKTSDQTQTEGKNVNADETDKILIAYFSWTNYTIVEGEGASINSSALEHYESAGDNGDYVDASSSTNIIQSGNVNQMASWIQGLSVAIYLVFRSQIFIQVIMMNI